MADKPIETCHLGNVRTPYHKISKDEYSYIHEHLETLAFIVHNFDCRNILEIGTGSGHSTLALATMTQGVVTTIDIEYKASVQKMVWEEGQGLKVNFITGASPNVIPLGAYDLILIDGNHKEEHVRTELRAISNCIQDGGFIILHDSCNPKWGPGIRKAIEDFYNDPEFRGLFDWWEWFNCNGLTVLRKRE